MFFFFFFWRRKTKPAENHSCLGNCQRRQRDCGADSWPLQSPRWCHFSPWELVLWLLLPALRSAARSGQEAAKAERISGRSRLIHLCKNRRVGIKGGLQPRLGGKMPVFSTLPKAEDF